MATRDRSQGFGFVYMNLGSFLSKHKEALSEDAPVVAEGAKILNFNKDTQFPVVDRRATPAPSESKTAADQIRENLDRLQTLHHRIHVMLEELNSLNGRKKDPKGDS